MIVKNNHGFGRKQSRGLWRVCLDSEQTLSLKVGVGAEGRKCRKEIYKILTSPKIYENRIHGRRERSEELRAAICEVWEFIIFSISDGPAVRWTARTQTSGTIGSVMVFVGIKFPYVTRLVCIEWDFRKGEEGRVAMPVQEYTRIVAGNEGGLSGFCVCLRGVRPSQHAAAKRWQIPSREKEERGRGRMCTQRAPRVSRQGPRQPSVSSKEEGREGGEKAGCWRLEYA
ncbi:hypothetical protein B0H10DRAFT_750876 [Mycena sp. CBHHK59/15]|nr:hypothetical protein B0H10DRAFT_750876 [Mycena sp. CBHHK59/15]